MVLALDDGLTESGDNENWTFVGNLCTATQGWKLYISASNADFGLILETVAPTLKKYGLSYKHVAGERALRKINSGLYGYTQIGKTIVVYIENENCIAALTSDLKALLSPFANSTILPPFADQIGAGLPISYRYGAFSGREIVLNGVVREDSRTARSSATPGLPPDPFAAMLDPMQPNSGLDALLVSYPVYEVLSQSAKGGVYGAMDLASLTFREVILKLGRCNGHILPDGRDGADLIKRECWFYGQAGERGLGYLIPAFDAMFEFDDAAAMIIERIEGENLQAIHLRGELDLSIVERALLVLENFHRSGLLVGDAKLANFLLDSRGVIKVIDFESGGILDSSNEPDHHTTFLFTNPALTNYPAEQELVHFLYSILHTEVIGSFDESSRIVDLGILLDDAGPKPEIEKTVRTLMRGILARIKG